MNRQETGFTIFEAVIAAALLSIGLLAAVKLMVNMRVGNQVAQQRREAMDYASNALEEMRAAGACTPIPSNTLAKRANDTAVYTLQATCTGNIATVTVIWNDSRGNQTKINGADNQVVFDSEI
ncbi:type II secretion system protein [Legionella sp. km772]|uniref:type IV pilus modification PilV family protein n=1 Tax=Legionella sp. km772 TaxID=2498111 RepID=UPI000F8C76F7|nr:type II secretion system protein [Legionella sp. km772]RUR06114.1 type II secretion system protein [Legionella sp. km772]